MVEDSKAVVLNPDLSKYATGSLNRGRPIFVEALWLFCQSLVLRNPFSTSLLRCLVLRVFGATIGDRVTIKAGVRIKFPWRLSLGNDTWIGEDVWIDNLAAISIGNNCCISQSVYLCTGSHDWSSESFDLIIKPISIDDGVWICARAVVGPGVKISKGAVLSLGSVATDNLGECLIYSGAPAIEVSKRSIRPKS